MDEKKGPELGIEMFQYLCTIIEETMELQMMISREKESNSSSQNFDMRFPEHRNFYVETLAYIAETFPQIAKMIANPTQEAIFTTGGTVDATINASQYRLWRVGKDFKIWKSEHGANF